MSTDDPVIEALVTATLTSGEKISTGVQRYTLSEMLADEGVHNFNGDPFEGAQEIVDALYMMLDRWHTMDTISVETQDRGKLKIAVHAVAYVEGYAKILD